MNTEEKIRDVIAFAGKFVGVPYAYGAHMEEAPKAFDCSGFVKYVFAHAEIDLPRSSVLQAKDSLGTEVPDMEKARAGDLLFMRSNKGYYDDEAFDGRKLYIGHVAIYCGDGMILHAKKSMGGVVLQKLSELQEDPNYEVVLIKRFL